MALGELTILHLADTKTPLSEAASELAGAQRKAKESLGLASVAESVSGLVVVTQTCDIVRSCTKRPYIEVAPLEHIPDPNQFNLIRKGWTPAYAYIPGVADQALAAHLDRTMTVEKSVVATWQRIDGCRNDIEARDFSAALARKRARWAFPDTFVAMTEKLRQQIRSNAGKVTAEGKMIDALKEMRVRAAPSWRDDEIALTFYFIKLDGADPATREEWARQVASWVDLIEIRRPFTGLDPIFGTLDDFDARDIVESDSLDFEYLSYEAA